MGADVGATRANDLSRQADDNEHAADNLASSRTDPNDAERDKVTRIRWSCPSRACYPSVPLSRPRR